MSLKNAPPFGSTNRSKKKGPNRLDKVEQSLKEVLANKMIIYASSFRGALVTVLRVDCSPDLKNAKVFLSVFGTENKEQEEDIFEELESRRAQLQHEIAKKIRMKNCPRLKFYKDGAIDKLVHVSNVLNENQ